MMAIRRFEDLIAWQKARELVRDVYQVTRKRSFARDFGLAGQIQRASVSVMSNIAEGFERAKRGEFHQFLCVAKGSAAELRSQLYIALDVGHVDQDGFDRLMAKAIETSKVAGGLRAAVARDR